MQIFSYPSVLTYVLGAQKNHIIETVLLSTHNICFGWEIRKLFFLVHTLNLRPDYTTAAPIFLLDLNYMYHIQPNKYTMLIFFIDPDKEIIFA